MRGPEKINEIQTLIYYRGSQERLAPENGDGVAMQAEATIYCRGLPKDHLDFCLIFKQLAEIISPSDG
jgi:hypothetical protein